MSDEQLRRMDEVEEWRQKAYALSRSDRLGHVVMKSLDLIQTVQRDGIDSENLSWEASALARDRLRTMNDDPKKDDPMRAMMYGMSASIGSMIESILEQSEKKMKDRKEERAEEMVTVLIPRDHAEASNVHLAEVGDVSDDREESSDAAERSAQSSVPPFVIFNCKAEPLFNANEVPFNNDRVADDSNDGYFLPMHGTIKEEGDTTMPYDDFNDTMEETGESMDYEDEEQPGTSADFLPSLPAHMRILTGEDDTSCDSTAGEAAAAVPAAAGSFGCSKCSKKFDSERALRHHSYVHNGVQCKICSTRLKDKKSLLVHNAAHHPGVKMRNRKKKEKTEKEKAAAPQKFGCDQCDKKFSNEKALHSHAAFHSYIKCAECGSGMKNQATLEKHFEEKHPGMAISTKEEGEKTYPDLCGHCRVRIQSRTHYEVHMRIHTGEKPFPCDKCPESFIATCYLKNHKRIFHGEKPFGCIPCGEKFDRRTELFEHNKKVHPTKRNSL